MGVDHSGTGKTPNRVLTMFCRFADWLGSLKSDNAKLNDEMTTLRYERDVLRWANKLLREELKAARPLVAYANRQKANRAKYDAKRRGK